MEDKEDMINEDVRILGAKPPAEEDQEDAETNEHTVFDRIDEIREKIDKGDYRLALEEGIKTLDDLEEENIEYTDEVIHALRDLLKDIANRNRRRDKKRYAKQSAKNFEETLRQSGYLNE